MTRSPILFLVFNRPQFTREVFARIREARPERLYIAADGPRPNIPGEAEICQAARNAASEVDWPCEVRTLFRDDNLGCRYAVSQAIDWFFGMEPEGIIIEDDCLPDLSFFRFCDSLLEHYRDDERVMAINGANKLSPQVQHSSYFFSRHCHVWGWATWRRAWKYYDVEMRSWPKFLEAGGLQAWASGEKDFERYWELIYTKTYEGFDTWDYQWMYACWSQGGLICRPYRNLVTNIGFGAGATHTHDGAHPDAMARAYEIDLPLRHPELFIRDFASDLATQGRAWKPKYPPQRWELHRRAAEGIKRQVKKHERLNRYLNGIRRRLALTRAMLRL